MNRFILRIMISVEELHSSLGYLNKTLVRHGLETKWFQKTIYKRNADMQSGECFSLVINGSAHLHICNWQYTISAKPQPRFKCEVVYFADVLVLFELSFIM